jgi:hypothetical protein
LANPDPFPFLRALLFFLLFSAGTPAADWTHYGGDAAGGHMWQYSFKIGDSLVAWRLPE